jgi:tRNA dimethylallyltransferase
MIGLKMQLPVNEAVVVILGPSAVGKTSLSIELAKRISGEVISVDSRYFYKGMDIGTAKPHLEEMRAIPHHLIDIAEPNETISLAQFQKMVYERIAAVLQRGNIPLLVGGTGQYIWGVVEGWLPPQARPDMKFREMLEKIAAQSGADSIYRMVAFLDPEAARNIEPKNVRRSIRALEVIFSTGELFSRQKAKNPPPYHFKIIGLRRPRTELYQRVDERIDRMLADGLIQETEKLMKAGYAPDLPSMSAIGYKEISSYLQNQITLEEAIALIKRRTRIFIRHQTNWFKKEDARIRWFDMQADVIEEIYPYIYSEEGWL